MNIEEAAGFPAVYLTAYYGMHELAHPRKNQVYIKIKIIRRKAYLDFVKV